MANNSNLTRMIFSPGEFYFVEEHGTKKKVRVILVFPLVLLPVELGQKINLKIILPRTD